MWKFLSLLLLYAISFSASISDGKTDYDTLAAAFEAARTAGSAITLTLKESITVSSPITVPATSYLITLDLATYTITNNVDDDFMLYLPEGAQLTITGSSGGRMEIPSGQYSKGFLRINDVGVKVTLTGGTYKGASFANTGLFFIVATGSDSKELSQSTSSIIEMTDLTVEASVNIMMCSGAYRTHCYLTVSGGTYTRTRTSATVPVSDTEQGLDGGWTLDGVEASFTGVSIDATPGPCVTVFGHHSNSSATEVFTTCTFGNGNKFISRSGTDSDNSAVSVKDGGVAVFNGGSYTANNVDAPATGFAVYMHNWGAYVTVNDGTFTGAEAAVHLGMAPSLEESFNYSCVLTINGGTFNGNIRVLDSGESMVNIPKGSTATFNHNFWFLSDKQRVPLIIGANIHLYGLASTNGPETVCETGRFGTIEDGGFLSVVSDGTKNPALNMVQFTITITTHDSEDYAVVPVLFTNSTGQLALYNLTFAWNPENTVTHQATVIEASSALVFMAGCTFTGIELATDPLIKPNYANQFATTIGEEPDNTFENIVRHEGSGSVFEAELSAGNVLNLATSSFTNCTSLYHTGTTPARAGAIYAILTDGTLNIAASVSFKRDSEDSAFTAAASAALCVEVTSDSLGTTSFYNNLNTRLSATADGEAWVNKKCKYYAFITFTSASYLTELSHAYTDPDPSGTLYYSTTGADSTTITKCGWADLPCNSLSTLYSLVSAGGTLAYEAGLPYTNTDLPTEVTKSITYDSSSATFTLASGCTSSDPLITINVGETISQEIIFTSMTWIVSNSAADAFKNPLLLVGQSNTGSPTLSLTDMTIKGEDNAESLASNLITVEIGSLSISSSAISDLTFGAFSAIAFSASPSGLTLSNSQFTSLKARSAGPVLLLTLPSDTTNDHPTLSALTFSDNQNTADNTKGNSIHIITTAAISLNKDSYFAVANWVGLLKSTGIAENQVLVDEDTDLYTSSPVAVTTTVSDNCDTSEGKCPTLLSALQYNSGISRAITYTETEATNYPAPTATIDSGAVVAIDHPLSVTGKGTEITTQIVTHVTNADYIFHIQTSGDVTFSSLTFAVVSGTPAFGANLFYVDTANKLSLTTVTVNVVETAPTMMSNEIAKITATMLDIRSGTLDLNGVTFNAMSFSDDAYLINADTASLSLTACTFNSITMTNTPLLKINPTSASTFALVKGGTVNAFNTITRAEGQGAVIDALLNSTTSLTLANASFTACSCTSTGVSSPLNGAVCLTIQDNAATIVFGSDLTFAASLTSGSEQQWTTDSLSAILFITDDVNYFTSSSGFDLKEDLVKTWSETTLYKYSALITSPVTYSVPLLYIFHNPYAKGETTFHVGEKGVDVDGCGWESLPCLTVDKAHTSLSSSDTKKVSLNEGTVALNANSAITLTTQFEMGSADAEKIASTILALGLINSNSASACIEIQQQASTFEVSVHEFTITVNADAATGTAVPAVSITGDAGTTDARAVLKLTKMTVKQVTKAETKPNIQTTLIDAAKGKLQLYSVTFKEMVFGSNAIFAIPTTTACFTMDAAEGDTSDYPNAFSDMTRTNYGTPVDADTTLQSGATVFELLLTDASDAVTITKAHFTSCHPLGYNSYGGAIFAYQTAGTLSITASKFSSGAVPKVRALGGSIFLSTTLSTPPTLTSLVFEKGTVYQGAVYSGYYLYYKALHADANLDATAAAAFLAGQTVSLNGRDFLLADADGTEQSMWLRLGEVKISITETANDCTSVSQTDCQTVKQAVTLASTSAAIRDITIQFKQSRSNTLEEVASTISKSVAITINDAETLTLSGTTTDPAFTITPSGFANTVTVTSLSILLTAASSEAALGASVFKLTAAGGLTSTLSLNKVSVSSSDQKTCYSAAAVIDAQNGKLELIGCQFSLITLTASSLLSVSTAYQGLKMSESDDNDTPKNTFTSIARSEAGNGAVFSVISEATTGNIYLPISSARFDGCTVVDGSYGGAIYIETKMLFSSFLDDTVTFTGDGAAGTALTYGKYLCYKATTAEANVYSDDVSTFYATVTSPTAGDYIALRYNAGTWTAVDFGSLGSIPITVTLTPASGTATTEKKATLEAALSITNTAAAYSTRAITIAADTTLTYTDAEGTTITRSVTVAPSDTDTQPTLAVSSLSGDLFTIAAIAGTTVEASFSSLIVSITADDSSPLQHSVFAAGSVGDGASVKLVLTDMTLKSGRGETTACYSQASVISFTSGELEVKDCKFTYIAMDGAPLLTTGHTTSITRSTFTSITRTDTDAKDDSITGGAVASITLGASQTLTLTTTKFIDCSSTPVDGKTILGGVLYISITDSTATLSFDSFDTEGGTSIRSNAAGTITAKYVYIACPDGYATAHASDLLAILPQNAENGEFMYAESDGTPQEIQSLSGADEPTTLTATLTGGEATCSGAEATCNTLKDAFDLINTDAPTADGYEKRIVDVAIEVVDTIDKILSVLRSTTLEQSGSGKITLSETTETTAYITIGSNKATSVTLTVDQVPIYISTSEKNTPIKRSLFFIAESSSSALRLQDLTITKDGENTAGYSSVSIIDAKNGQLTLTGCSFEDLTVTAASPGAPLLAVDPTKLSMQASGTPTKNSFTSIVRKHGNGAVFELNLDSEVSVTIQEATFTKCSVNGGNGGAIAVSLTPASASLTIGNNEEENVIFSGCTADGTLAKYTVGYGGAIFISSSLAPSNIQLKNVKFENIMAVSGLGKCLYYYSSSEGTTGNLVSDHLTKFLPNTVTPHVAGYYYYNNYVDGTTRMEKDVFSLAAEEPLLNPATLHDTSEAVKDEDLYESDSYSLSTQGSSPVTIKMSISKLKYHANADSAGNYGYWVGPLITAPGTTKLAGYVFSSEEITGTSADTITWSSPASYSVDSEPFYVNAYGTNGIAEKKYVAIKLNDDTVYKYVIDLTDVKVEPVVICTVSETTKKYVDTLTQALVSESLTTSEPIQLIAPSGAAQSVVASSISTTATIAGVPTGSAPSNPSITVSAVPSEDALIIVQPTSDTADDITVTVQKLDFVITANELSKPLFKVLKGVSGGHAGNGEGGASLILDTISMTLSEGSMSQSAVEVSDASIQLIDVTVASGISLTSLPYATPATLAAGVYVTDSYSVTMAVDSTSSATVDIAVEGLKYHKDADENYGYWVGAVLTAPGSKKITHYYFGDTQYTESAVPDVSWTVADGGVASATFQFNALNKPTKYVTLKLENDDTLYKYSLDSTNVELETPVTLTQTGSASSTYRTLEEAVTESNSATEPAITISASSTLPQPSTTAAITKTVSVTGDEKDTSCIFISEESASVSVALNGGALDTTVKATFSTLTVLIGVSTTSAGTTSVFTVSSDGATSEAYAKLVLENVAFVSGLSPSSCTLSNPLVDATNGQLQLTGCSFSDITLSSSSLLAVDASADALAMTKYNGETANTFISIKRTTASTSTNAGGAVFEIVSTLPTDKVSIQNAEFYSCGVDASATGTFYGGIIYLSFSDSSAEISGSNLKYSDTLPGSGSRHNNDRTIVGSYVYVALTAAFTDMTTLTQLLETTDNCNSQTNLFVYQIGSEGVKEICSLLETPPETEDLYVMSNGEGSDCTGEEQANACSSLSTAVAKVSATEATIHLSAETVKSNTYLAVAALQVSVTIEGVLDAYGNPTTITAIENLQLVDEHGLIYIQPEAKSITVSFEKMAFYILNNAVNGWAAPLFEVENNNALTASLTLNSVTIAGKTDNGGTYNKANTELITSSIVKATESSISLSSCTISDIKLGSVPCVSLELAAGCAASITSTQFTSITGAGDGAVLKATAAGQLGQVALTGITITECKSSDGAAIYLEIESDTSFETFASDFTFNTFTLNYDWSAVEKPILKMKYKGEVDTMTELDSTLKSSGLYYPQFDDVCYLTNTDGNVHKQFYESFNVLTADGKNGACAADGDSCETLGGAIEAAMAGGLAGHVVVSIAADELSLAQSVSYELTSSLIIAGIERSNVDSGAGTGGAGEEGEENSYYTLTIDCTESAGNGAIFSITGASKFLQVRQLFISLSNTARNQLGHSLFAVSSGAVLLLDTIAIQPSEEEDSNALSSTALIDVNEGSACLTMLAVSRITAASNAPILITSPVHVSGDQLQFGLCSGATAGVASIANLVALDRVSWSNVLIGLCTKTGTGAHNVYVTIDTVNGPDSLEAGAFDSSWSALKSTWTVAGEFVFRNKKDTNDFEMFTLTAPQIDGVDAILVAGDKGTTSYPTGTPSAPYTTLQAALAANNDEDTPRVFALIPATHTAPDASLELKGTVTLTSLDDAPAELPINSVSTCTFKISRKTDTTSSTVKVSKLALSVNTQNAFEYPVFLIDNSDTSGAESTVELTSLSFHSSYTGSSTDLSTSLITVQSGDLSLTSVSFIDFGFAADQSLLSTQTEASQITLSACTFDTITLNNQPLLSVSQIELSSVTGNDGAILNTFKTISRSNGNGAVLSLSVGGGKSVTLDNAVFLDCSSAIYLVLNTKNEAESLTLGSSLSFTYTTEPTNIATSAVVFATSDGSLLQTYDVSTKMDEYDPLWKGANEDTHSSYYYLCMIDGEGEIVYSVTLKAALVDSATLTSSTAEVAKYGADVVGCGGSELPCHSFDYARQLSTNPSTVQLKSAMTVDKAIASLSLQTPLTVKGETKASSIISVTSEPTGSPLISLTTPNSGSRRNVEITLAIQTLTFALTIATADGSAQSLLHVASGSGEDTAVLDITDVSFESVRQEGEVGQETLVTSQYGASLITATGGQLKLTGCSFNLITITSDSPLLNVGVAEGSLTMAANGATLNSFSNIARSTGNGAVFQLNAGSSYVNIASASFANCSAEPYGGAIYITLASEPTSLVLQDLTFSSVGTNEIGTFVYIDASRVEGTTWLDSANTLKVLSPQTHNYFVYLPYGKSQGTEEQDIFSYYEGTLLFVNHLAANSGSEDTATCGVSATPCRTLALATTSTRYQTFVDIRFVQGEHLAETTQSSIVKDTSISGATSTPSETTLTIATVDSKDHLISVASTDAAVTLTVSYITFKATANSDTGVFALSKPGSNAVSLSLSHVAFENTANTITYSKSIISADQGSVTLSSVSFTTMGLSGAVPLIDASQGSLSIEDTSFTTIALGTSPLLSLPSTGMTVKTGNSFKTITNANVLSITSSTIITGTGTTNSIIDFTDESTVNLVSVGIDKTDENTQKLSVTLTLKDIAFTIGNSEGVTNAQSLFFVSSEGATDNAKATLSLDGVSFTTSLTTAQGAPESCVLSAALITSTSGVLSLKACSFSYITSSTSLLAVGSEASSLVMSESDVGNIVNTFSYITSTTNGVNGAVFSLSVNSGTSFSLPIQYATFTGCSVTDSGKGGAVYVSTSVPPNTFLGTSVVFEEGTPAPLTTNGKYIYYESTSIEANLYSPDVSVFMTDKTSGPLQASDGDYVAVNYVDGTNTDTKQFTSLLSPPMSISYSKDGAQTSTSRTLHSAIEAMNVVDGSMTDRVITINGAWLDVDAASTVTQTMSLSQSTGSIRAASTTDSSTAYLTVGGTSVTLTVNAVPVYIGSSAVLNPVGRSVFSISGTDGTLALKDLTITRTDGNNAQSFISKSVVDASTGTLELYGVTFSYITLTTASPLLAVKADLTMSLGVSEPTQRNVFTGIVRNAADGNSGGAVFQISLANGDSISISNADFTNCGMDASVETYYGGVIYISVTGTPTLSASSLTFSGSVTGVRSNDAVAEYVYISLPAGYDNLKPLKGFLSTTYSSEDAEKYQYSIASGATGNIGDLTTKYYVQLTAYAEGDKDQTCKTETKSTCASIQDVLALTEDNAITSEDQIEIAYDATSYSSASFKSSLTLSLTLSGKESSGSYPTATMDLTDSSSLLTIAASSSAIRVAVSTLNFIYSSDDSAVNGPIFKLTAQYPAIAATLSLTTVKIQGSATASTQNTAAITDCAIDASAGLLILSGVTFEYIQLASHPLILQSTLAANLDLLTGTGNEPNRFTSIVRSTGSGAVFAVTLDSANNGINLQNAVFTGCSSEENAGAVYVSITGTGATFGTLSNVEFKTSEGSANEWAGAEIDAITFVAQTSDSDLESYTGITALISDVSTYNSKYYAKVSTAPLISLYYYLVSPTDTIIINSNAGSGFDFAHCGSAELPCQSLSKMVGSKNTQIIKGGTYTSTSIAFTKSPTTTVSGQGATNTNDGSVITITANTQYTSSSVQISLQSLCLAGAVTLTDSLFSISGTGSLELNTVLFDTIALTGHPLISGVLGATASSLSIVNTANFNTITRTDAGAIVLEGTVPTGGLNLEGATFTDCSSSATDSSVLKLTLSAGDLELTDSQFVQTGNDWSDGKRYGLWALGTSAQIVPTTSTTTSTTLKNLADASAPGNTWTANSEKKHYVTLDSHPAPLSHVYYTPAFANPSVESVAVKSDGLDVDGCGWDDIPCLTVNKAATHLDTNKKIMLKSATYSVAANIKHAFTDSLTIAGAVAGTKLTTQADFFTITGVIGKEITIENVTVDSPTQNFFTSNAANTIIMDHLVFGTEATTRISTGSLMSISAGSVTLKDVSVQCITLDAASLLACTGASVTIQDSSAFTSISSSSTGAVLTQTLSSSSKLTLDSSVTFKACSSALSVLYLTVDSTATLANSLSLPATLNLKTAEGADITTWTPATSVIAFATQDISYLKTGHLALTALLTTYTLSGTYPASIEDKFYCRLLDGTGAALHTWPLARVFFAPNYEGSSLTTFYVSTDGAADNFCGWDDLPCTTYDKAASLLPAEAGTVTVYPGTYTKTQMKPSAAITKPLTILGVREDVEVDGETVSTLATRITQDEASFFTVSTVASGKTVEFKQLAFTLSAEGGKLIASSAPGTVRLNDVMITGSTSDFTLTDSLLVATAGTLQLNDVIIASVSVSGAASLVDTHTARLEISNSAMMSIALNNAPLVSVSSSKNALTLTGTNLFQSITRTTGNGGVFAPTVEEGDDLTITAATFEDCGCLNGNGGALYVTVTGGSFTLGETEEEDSQANAASKVTFKGCYASSTGSRPTSNADSGNGGSLYVDVPTDSEGATVTMAQVEVKESQAASSGGGVYVAVAEGAQTATVAMESVAVKESTASNGNGGGILVDVAKGTTGVTLNVADVTVADSTAKKTTTPTDTVKAQGDAIYLNVKSDDTKLDLKSVTVASAEKSTEETASESTVYVAVTNATTAADSSLWSEIKTGKVEDGEVVADAKSEGSSDFKVATQTQSGEVISTHSTQEIIAESKNKEKEPDDDKSYWWIVFPILAFVIIIVVLVILDYILVCRKEQEGDKATKYEEGGEKTEEMETTKFEEEGESELALVTVPSVSEKPDEEEETTTPSEESKPEETKAEEPTTETTSSSASTSEPSTSEAPATETSTSSSSSTEPSPSESSSSAEASSSSASASSSSSSESTPSESSSATESSSAEASSTSSGTESSPSQPSEPSAQSEPSPKEESSSSTGESSETVAQSAEPSVDSKQE